jgi:hypothetical protein
MIAYEQISCADSGVTYRLTPEIFRSASQALIWIEGLLWYLVDDSEAEPSGALGLLAGGNSWLFTSKQFYPSSPHLILKSPGEIRNFRCRRTTGLLYSSPVLKAVYKSGFRVEG